jgi:hypothetical protein
MHANRITATVLFTLATLTTACAGFEGQDDFGADVGDDDGLEDRDDAGAEGHENGGDEDGNDEGDDRKPPRAGDDDGHGPDCEDDVRDPAEPADSCEPTSGVLIAAQQFDTGTVTLTNTEGALEIALQTEAPYQLIEIHAYVGVEAIVDPSPGSFPHVVELAEPIDAYHLSVSLTELAVGCGDELHVAVHAVVVSFENGVEVFEETAWMLGNEQFDEGWGWSADYAVCCEG